MNGIKDLVGHSVLYFESTFSVLVSSGALVTSNSLSFLIPMNVVSGE